MGTPPPDDMTGRTCLITGANSGIGHATALGLADKGAKLILAGRDATTTQAVIDEIEAAGKGTAEYVHLDLADLESVRACADEVLARDAPLHVLLNNAGVAGKKGVTAQGFELTFGVNHLGPFLLTQLLLGRLQASGPARIVNVASDAHFGAKAIDFDALQRPTKSFGGLREYQVSKLCNVLFTQELARRVEAEDIAAYAVHPGVVASNIWREVPWPIRPVVKRFMTSTTAGAETSIYCAASPDVTGQSGKYFEKCQEHPASEHATPELAEELWARSAEWTA